jgi:hypothetical protein
MHEGKKEDITALLYKILGEGYRLEELLPEFCTSRRLQ